MSNQYIIPAIKDSKGNIIRNAMRLVTPIKQPYQYVNADGKLVTIES